MPSDATREKNMIWSQQINNVISSVDVDQKDFDILKLPIYRKISEERIAWMSHQQKESCRRWVRDKLRAAVKAKQQRPANTSIKNNNPIQNIAQQPVVPPSIHRTNMMPQYMFRPIKGLHYMLPSSMNVSRATISNSYRPFHALPESKIYIHLWFTIE